MCFLFLFLFFFSTKNDMGAWLVRRCLFPPFGNTRSELENAVKMTLYKMTESEVHAIPFLLPTPTYRPPGAARALLLRRP